MNILMMRHFSQAYLNASEFFKLFFYSFVAVLGVYVFVVQVLYMTLRV